MPLIKTESDYPSLPVSKAFAETYPNVMVYGCTVRLRSPDANPDFGGAWEELHQTWRGRTKQEVAAIPQIAAYRNFYRAIGLNPDRTKPSIQGIIERFLIGEVVKPLLPLPPLVNLVNIVAVRTLIPLGAFDSDTLVGDAQIDFAGNGEKMIPIGSTSEIAIEPGAVVLRDNIKILSQFGHRDADSQKITDRTQQLMLLGCLVPGIERTAVFESLTQTVQELEINFSGVSKKTICSPALRDSA